MMDSFRPLWNNGNVWEYERVWEVNNPGLYACQKEKRHDTAIIMIPGGAYRKLNPLLNGKNYAQAIDLRCNTDSFVLLHTLPTQCDGNYKQKKPIEDLEKAIVNLYFDGYKKIGIWGTSAGGHLACMVKSDFKILFSPVITMQELYSNKHSMDNFLGLNANQSLKDYYSAQYKLDYASRFTYILQSFDDKKVHPINAIMYANMLVTNGYDCELHLFSTGDHEICLNFTKWFDPLIKWLNEKILVQKPEIALQGII